MPRELTKKEEEAVNRLERALAAIPDTLFLYFNEGGFDVFDPSNWLEAEGQLAVEEIRLDHRLIDCNYDTGAL